MVVVVVVEVAVVVVMVVVVVEVVVTVGVVVTTCIDRFLDLRLVDIKTGFLWDDLLGTSSNVLIGASLLSSLP